MIEAKLVDAISSGSRHENQSLSHFASVSTDSRVKRENGLFIPLVGERFDGHDYILDAIQGGATASIWQKDKPIPESLPQTFQLYYVEDTLAALQELSKKYLQAVNPIVVGVTGSNGKTTTKDILEAVLSTSYKTHKTQGNYNNHIGLPLTILAMPKDCELIILEMGMSDFREIALLSEIAAPDYAIVTNIGESHIQNLGSREGIAKAKMEIAEGLKANGVVIFDGDEPLLQSYRNPSTLTCGFNDKNYYQVTDCIGDERGYSFTINDSSFQYQLPLLGKHNIKNALYAIVVAKKLQISDSLINKGLTEISLTGMRLERKEGLNGSLVINDAYNASPTSMKAAVSVIKGIGNFTKRIVILGDIYELGMNEEELHRSVAEVIDEPITHAWLVGEKGKWIYDELQKRQSHRMDIRRYETKEDVSKDVIPLLTEDTIVLIKASRGLKLETVVEEIIKQG
ncbi:UDP-N-acetylmuramoyl-tripeptide--D-alanyl-D-alanine ligase [Bacillus alkalicellulosilyticus]|uniref:UDP-N-acetylmuramoyl-tripeptide--D-alanyl-D- alanine ligase n=1 Tax=Alkalihalobacterium alkalicellulosilyticum TaxID=1912214 RepID=UPI000997DE27|nr:UDP-N-acetylmuramoyl-tripeptide--D-alanyl-D-alanine ligase [Bacillus alkalicellulosilyticus]